MRKIDAQQRREAAARIAREREHPVHRTNNEEPAYRDAKSFMTFTKGLPHDPKTGLVKDELDPVRFRDAIDSGYVGDFDDGVPLGDRDGRGRLQWHFHTTNDPETGQIDLSNLADGKQHRRWEAPTAGWVFDLEGPDCQAVTMPPAPPIVVRTATSPAAYKPGHHAGHGVKANPELVAELAEVYWWARLRDTPFGAFDAVSRDRGEKGVDEVERAANYMTALPFYGEAGPDHPRRRHLHDQGVADRQNLLRGHTPGDRKGPYLSQFLLLGDQHLGRDGNKPRFARDGILRYGAIRVDMRVRQATPERNYMTHWNAWLDVQNGADVAGTQAYVDKEAPDAFRFIATPRDLATYVHHDALYEAYLNACLWLLGAKAPFDPNFAHRLGKTRHTEGFALFGGPHILSLVTEVATRGLKAVRFQKFNSHLRLRPEALAGLVAAHRGNAPLPAGPAADFAKLLHDALDQSYGGVNILGEIAALNKKQHTDTPKLADYIGGQRGIARAADLPLLPMAFAEGSPMHPSYGAGHATVAGACVTILKAFFDEDACLVKNGDAVKAVPANAAASGGNGPVAFVPGDNGCELVDKGDLFGEALRVGDELDKLAANISIGRNMAGVHYYSDYIDSLRMGEEIAIGVLQEQSLMYPKDRFQLSFTSFDGREIVIGEGEVYIQPLRHPKDKGQPHAYVASGPVLVNHDAA